MRHLDRGHLLVENLFVLLLLNGVLIQTPPDITLPQQIARDEERDVDGNQADAGREAPRKLRGFSNWEHDDVVPGEERPADSHLYQKHPAVSFRAANQKMNWKAKRGFTHHSASGEALGLVVVFHDDMDEGEDHGGHAGVEPQQEPGREFQADGDTPDSQTDVAEEQNDAGKGEWHPDRVDPVKKVRY